MLLLSQSAITDILIVTENNTNSHLLSSSKMFI